MYMPAHIPQVLASPDGQRRLRGILVGKGSPTRTEIARRVCKAFKFFDARGALRLSSCRAALTTLARKGVISLPASLSPRRAPARPRSLDRPVRAAREVPNRVDRIAWLRLLRVTTAPQQHVWNRLMQDEHAQGAVRHAGHQLRYLVLSPHGLVAAAGFAAAAPQLAARDAWIGWDPAARTAHMHQVIALSRFLVRPGLACDNLASCVLAMLLRRVSNDFEEQHGFRPVLIETFNDPARHKATSLRATHWHLVGKTSGVGRYALPGAARKTPKQIYLYPLAADWKTQLGVTPARVAARGAGEGLDEASWAANEFGAASLGDARLTRRLVQSASIQAAAPDKSFIGAAGTDKAAISGYYRLIEHPDATAVSVKSVVAAHRGRTQERMQDQSVCLVIEDGTDLNFATRGGCKGLGTISKNKGSSGTLGLHLHSSYVTSGTGVPLGVARMEFEAPDGKPDRNKPVDQRKSARWLRGFADTVALASPLVDTQVIAVCDREADIHALFARQQDNDGVALLVRAKHDRSLGKDTPKLFETIRAMPACGHLEVVVPRSSARRAARGQKASAKRDARVANTELRWRTVDLPAPGRARKAPLLRVTMIHVLERDPPAEVEPLEWFLLTTLPVTGQAEAEQVIEWYRLRWRIEDWHRMMKTGCQIEKIGHQTAERLERAVAINGVIAWRLEAMKHLARDMPELPAETLLSETEIEVLQDVATDKNLPLPTPLTIGTTILLIAMIGGYLNRKHDGPPGQTVLWRGYAYLAVAIDIYQRLKRMDLLPKHQQLRPDKNSR